MEYVLILKTKENKVNIHKVIKPLILSPSVLIKINTFITDMKYGKMIRCYVYPVRIAESPLLQSALY